jgi:peptidoglycan/xylan/chitin deacetylase (PgdA/CDA1 family)
MRLGIGALFRTIRRSVTRFTTVPLKHVKIDDEERATINDDYHFPARSRSRSLGIARMILLSLLALLVLVLLFAYIIYKPPKFVIDYLQWKYPDVLFHLKLPESSRVIALTIDDAPSDETSRILDLLKIYNSKATFFVIGSQVASHPDLLRRIHDEGHELGNHAWADEPSVQLPLSELERQIKDLETILPPNRPTTGSKISPKYFRPGSGFFSKQMVKMVRKMGYRVVLGSIYPHDPQIHYPRINAKHVLSMARPGAVIIMHDRRSYSADQIELVLGGLKKRNYKVESLGGMIGVLGTEKVR